MNQTKPIEDWKYPHQRIRVRKVISEDLSEMEFQFQTFDRPYFFGLLGERRWIQRIQTNDFVSGMNWCNQIISKYHGKYSIGQTSGHRDH